MNWRDDVVIQRYSALIKSRKMVTRQKGGCIMFTVKFRYENIGSHIENIKRHKSWIKKSIKA